MWTVSLTVEIKLRFDDGLVWTVSLTVEIKLRFDDGLVLTVSLTVEIKLRVPIPQVFSAEGVAKTSPVEANHGGHGLYSSWTTVI